MDTQKEWQCPARPGILDLGDDALLLIDFAPKRLKG